MEETESSRDSGVKVTGDSDKRASFEKIHILAVCFKWCYIPHEWP